LVKLHGLPDFSDKHLEFLAHFGFPPAQGMAKPRGLDARGLPKFRVRAGRREVRA
jgi:hypothetical protein